MEFEGDSAWIDFWDRDIYLLRLPILLNGRPGVVVQQCVKSCSKTIVKQCMSVTVSMNGGWKPRAWILHTLRPRTSTRTKQQVPHAGGAHVFCHSRACIQPHGSTSNLGRPMILSQSSFALTPTEQPSEVEENSCL